jgi:hypothetical protein
MELIVNEINQRGQTDVFLIIPLSQSPTDEIMMLHLNLNSGALVRQRTIPTERPSLVGEVSANFSG